MPYTAPEAQGSLPRDGGTTVFAPYAYHVVHHRSAARARAHRDAQPDAQAHAGAATRWSGGLARIRHGQAPPARAADVRSAMWKRRPVWPASENISANRPRLAEAGHRREAALSLIWRWQGVSKPEGEFGRSLWGGCFPHRFWPAIPALFSAYRFRGLNQFAPVLGSRNAHCLHQARPKPGYRARARARVAVRVAAVAYRRL